MRARPLPLALAATSLVLAPRGAAADDAAAAKPATPLGPMSSAPTPLRAYVAAAAVERPPVSPALVIAGGVVAGVGAVGALTGLVLGDHGRLALRH